MDLELILKEALPHLTQPVIDALKRGLKDIERKVTIREVEKLTARTILKSMDAVMTTVARNLTPEDALLFVEAYTSQLKIQLLHLTIAIKEYAPRALAVEVAKKEYGSSSPEAKKARADRQQFIENLREEVRDVLIAALGNEPED